MSFVSKAPVDMMSELVLGMAIGDKPLPEPMMTQFTDAYIRHQASMVSYYTPATASRCVQCENMNDSYILLHWGKKIALDINAVKVVDCKIR